MTLHYFSDILFDLLNDSDELDVYDIERTETGYRITVSDGSLFNVNISRAEPKDNVLQLYPGRQSED
ncbi:MAG: hypothetical protein IJA67_05365 [Oscillospiraceae bacterium]|nr:hypothetical protein [Oscillospiraceae bacterium]